MKKRKITLLFIFLSLCIVVISLCVVKMRKAAEDNDGAIDVIPGPAYAWTSNDDGVYYSYTDSYDCTYLHYIDYATSEDVPVCNKPNCPHTNDTCNAYWGSFSDSEFISRLYVQNDILYVAQYTEPTGISGFASMKFYSQNLDGTERTELFFLDCENIQDFAAADTAFYFLTITVDKEFSREYDGKDFYSIKDEVYDEAGKHSVYNLWRYDIDKGTLTCIEEEVVEMADLYFVSFLPSSKADTIYLWRTDYTGIESDTTADIDIYSYNVETGELENAFTGLVESGVNPSMFDAYCVYDECFYFVGSEADSKGFYRYDIDSDEVVRLAEITGEISGEIQNTYLIDNRIVFNIGYGEGNSSYARTYRRIVYYDMEKEVFYVAKDGVGIPKYSSGDKGIVDYTDYYLYDKSDYGMVLETYDYVVTDMPEYYSENYEPYSNEYPDVLILE